MVRIPSLRRSETAPAQDENHDGRIDERDGRTADDTQVTRTRPVADTRRDGERDAVADAPADDARTYRSRAATMRRDRPAADDQTTTMDRADTVDLPPNRARTATDRTTTDRTTTGEPAAGRSPVRPSTGSTDRTPAADATRERDVAVVAGPKPRASLLATLGLIVGVAAALFVLTGALAGYGIGLGVLALLLSIGGISATGRRHIAGKSDALIGLALGLGAVVVGILAMTGQFVWPDTDVNTVQQFREWLDSQVVDRF